MKSSLAAISLGLLLVQTQISAHHATAAQFDTTTTITFKGTIAKLDWANPHVHIDLDVKQEHWVVELPAPGGIIVAGLSKDALQPGAAITIKGYPSKNSGNHSACATQLTLSDGTTAN